MHLQDCLKKIVGRYFIITITFMRRNNNVLILNLKKVYTDRQHSFKNISFLLILKLKTTTANYGDCMSIQMWVRFPIQ